MGKWAQTATIKLICKQPPASLPDGEMGSNGNGDVAGSNRSQEPTRWGNGLKRQRFPITARRSREPTRWGNGLKRQRISIFVRADAEPTRWGNGLKRQLGDAYSQAGNEPTRWGNGLKRQRVDYGSVDSVGAYQMGKWAQTAKSSWPHAGSPLAASHAASATLSTTMGSPESGRPRCEAANAPEYVGRMPD